MKNIRAIMLASLILSIGSVGSANAERYVFVNGMRMNHMYMAALDQWHCGYVPNGNYWLNINTGVWGYANNPVPQGNITDNCGYSTRRPGLSERGLLYSPGELLR